MGEAKRRAAAYAEGRPFAPPRVCPRCKSIRISRLEPREGPQFLRKEPYDVCRDCGTVWEAYPPDWCEEVVGAEPCDNCAFRAGSPEQADPAAWRELIATLRAGGEFKCHKGAPILGLDKAKKNSKGTYTVEFDQEWIARHGRLCAGFMRMVWVLGEKGEDWLAARFPEGER